MIDMLNYAKNPENFKALGVPGFFRIRMKYLCKNT